MNSVFSVVKFSYRNLRKSKCRWHPGKPRLGVLVLWSAFLLSQERQFGMATVGKKERGLAGEMEIGDNGSGISEVPRREIWANECSEVSQISACYTKVRAKPESAAPPSTAGDEVSEEFLNCRKCLWSYSFLYKNSMRKISLKPSVMRNPVSLLHTYRHMLFIP